VSGNFHAFSSTAADARKAMTFRNLFYLMHYFCYGSSGERVGAVWSIRAIRQTIADYIDDLGPAVWTFSKLPFSILLET
jgi:hypothetical protein